MNDPAGYPPLEGLRFAALVPTEGGEVNPETIFEYRESGGEIWASYSGGAIRRGFLVGTRTGDSLSFRYGHLNIDGKTSSGRCESQITETEDGRLRLEETWQWESQEGAGTSTLEELRR